MGFWSSVGNFVGGLFGGGAAAGINAAAGVISNAQQFDYQKKLQQHSFDLSKKLQQFQNDYSTRMASSAHQLEVSDLRKAGLNPILSATGGSGASSFSSGGATISAGQAGAPDISDLGSTAVQTAQSIKLNDSQIALQKEQKENYKADSYLKGNMANTESEKFNTQIALTKDIENQIKNRNLVSGAQAEYYRKLGSSALTNALANVLTSQSSSARNYQDIRNMQQQYRIDKRQEDFNNTDYGRGLYKFGQTTGAIGNIFSGNASFNRRR